MWVVVLLGLILWDIPLGLGSSSRNGCVFQNRKVFFSCQTWTRLDYDFIIIRSERESVRKIYFLWQLQSFPRTKSDCATKIKKFNILFCFNEFDLRKLRSSPSKNPCAIFNSHAFQGCQMSFNLKSIHFISLILNWYLRDSGTPELNGKAVI